MGLVGQVQKDQVIRLFLDLRIKLTALALVNLKGRVKLEKEIEMKENSSPREKRH